MATASIDSQLLADARLVLEPAELGDEALGE
jgi:hypothetical protein